MFTSSRERDTVYVQIIGYLRLSRTFGVARSPNRTSPFLSFGLRAEIANSHTHTLIRTAVHAGGLPFPTTFSFALRRSSLAMPGVSRTKRTTKLKIGFCFSERSGTNPRVEAPGVRLLSILPPLLVRNQRGADRNSLTWLSCSRVRSSLFTGSCSNPEGSTITECRVDVFRVLVGCLPWHGLLVPLVVDVAGTELMANDNRCRTGESRPEIPDSPIQEIDDEAVTLILVDRD